jgi:hypothetical protein
LGIALDQVHMERVDNIGLFCGVPRCTDRCTQQPLPIALAGNEHLKVREEGQQAYGEVIRHWYTWVYYGGVLGGCALVYRGGPLGRETRCAPVYPDRLLYWCARVCRGVLPLILRGSDVSWLTFLLPSVKGTPGDFPLAGNFSIAEPLGLELVVVGPVDLACHG